MRFDDRRWLAVGLGAAALAGAVWGTPLAAQARQGAARPQAREPYSLQFGDVTLSRFATLQWTIGKIARVSGPETTVDAVDAQQGSRTRLQAASIVAHADPKNPNQVVRVEASQNVRFSNTRTVEGGRQVVTGSGRKATYQRQAGVVTVDGPVQFKADQPTADGKQTQTVEGTADKVTYDEGKRILTFSGDVKGTITVPEIASGGQPFSGDEVRIEMAQRPYQVTIENPSLRGEVRLRPR